MPTKRGQAMAIRMWSSTALVAVLLLPAGAGAQSADLGAGPTLDARIALPDGRRLHLVCTGPELTPHPIVLFETDLGRAASTWSTVQDALPVDVRACAYDRPGTGSSERSAGPRTPDDEVADLHALLAAAEVPPPYVVVADGVGTWFAAAFAMAHPDELAGMVLTDPVSPTRDAALRQVLGEPVAGERMPVTLMREALDAFLSPPESTPGQVDLRALAGQAVRLDLGARPLVVLEPTRSSGRLSSDPLPRTRPVPGRADPWDAAWDRIRDWSLTRSARVTHRFVAGAEGIAGRAPQAVTDAIGDVVAAVGIDKGPGRAIARLRVPRHQDGVRVTDRWVSIDDRSGTLLAIRPANAAELATLSRLRGGSQPNVRVLDADRTRLGITWQSGSRGCEPEAHLVLDAERMRVMVDVPRTVTVCTLMGVVQAVVAELRVPLPAIAPSIVVYRGLATFLGSGPSRIVVERQGEAGIDHVEIEDHTRDLLGGRALRSADEPAQWRGDAGGVQTARVDGELLIRWGTLPCVTWSRITIAGDGSVAVADGAVPDCDAAAASRGVALRFRRPLGPVPGSTSLTGAAGAVPAGALTRQQAEAMATSLSLVVYRVLGVRLAKAAGLDARLAPPDRWVWAVALANEAGNDVCPDGITWEGLPCPNLSSLTVFLDAVTGELLGTEPGAF